MSDNKEGLHNDDAEVNAEKKRQLEQFNIIVQQIVPTIDSVAEVHLQKEDLEIFNANMPNIGCTRRHLVVAYFTISVMEQALEVELENIQVSPVRVFEKIRETLVEDSKVLDTSSVKHVMDNLPRYIPSQQDT